MGSIVAMVLFHRHVDSGGDTREKQIFDDGVVGRMKFDCLLLRGLPCCYLYGSLKTIVRVITHLPRENIFDSRV